MKSSSLKWWYLITLDDSRATDIVITYLPPPAYRQRKVYYFDVEIPKNDLFSEVTKRLQNE